MTSVKTSQPKRTAKVAGVATDVASDKKVKPGPSSAFRQLEFGPTLSTTRVGITTKVDANWLEIKSRFNAIYVKVMGEPATASVFFLDLHETIQKARGTFASLQAEIFYTSTTNPQAKKLANFQLTVVQYSVGADYFNRLGLPNRQKLFLKIGEAFNAVSQAIKAREPADQYTANFRAAMNKLLSFKGELEQRPVEAAKSRNVRRREILRSLDLKTITDQL